MRVLWLDPAASFLEERRQLGHDRRDEVWDGVIHVPPDPSPQHQEMGADLLEVLRPIARRLGLAFIYETGVYEDDRNYRSPDLVAYDRKFASKRGIEGMRRW